MGTEPVHFLGTPSQADTFFRPEVQAGPAGQPDLHTVPSRPLPKGRLRLMPRPVHLVGAVKGVSHFGERPASASLTCPLEDIRA